MTKRAPINIILWAVVSDDGWFPAGTSLYRREAIRQHCADFDMTWPDCRKRGFRCVKVRVTEIVR